MSGVIAVLGFGVEDAGGFEFLQAVGEDVGGDAFARFLKFLERTVAAHHEVADDQQRPAVSEGLKRQADGAAGTTFGRAARGHESDANKVTCKMQVIFWGKIFWQAICSLKVRKLAYNL